MKARNFVILAAATAAAVVAAVVVLQQRQATTEAPPSGAMLLAGFVDRVNEVDKLTIRSRTDGTVTLERKDEQWKAAERAGYPANVEKIRSTLVQLSQFKTIEPLTANPELHKRLQVEAIDAPESASVQVTAAAGGTVLADLVIGKTRAEQHGGVFVRKANETQAWVVEGSLQPDKRLVSWLDRDILNVDSRRVRTISLSHADGERVGLEKSKPDDRDQTLTTAVPEGSVAKAAYELNAVASIPDYLILEDVRPKTEVNFATPAVTAEFVTFDGLKLTMRLVDQDGQSWVEVVAATVDPWPGLAEFVQKKDEDSDAGRAAKIMKDADAIARDAAGINARAADWAYRVTDYKAGKLKSRLADLIEPKKEEEKKEEDKDGERKG